MSGTAVRFEVLDRANGTGPIPIDAARFAAIAAAHEGLLHILAVEEAYDILVLNHVELERGLFDQALSDMMFPSAERVTMEKGRRDIDRRIANLLSSGRMFVDHQKRVSTAVFGKGSPEAKAVDHSIQRHGETWPGFRATEALRNYVQHCGLPVGSWTRSGSWIEDPAKGGRLRHSFSVAFAPDGLRATRLIDKSVLSVLDARRDGSGLVPLLPMLREYTMGMSYVIEDFRSGIDAKFREWSLALAIELQQFAVAAGGVEPQGAVALAFDAAGRTAQMVALQFDVEERLADLQERNRRLTNLH
ncbi:MAG: hypothetical protein JWO33_2645, partial [Caulobacteraceae bacterium]|nr:hypothetical protein [Caulobacteraceae bacterium]